jgi:hypothetical protein
MALLKIVSNLHHLRADVGEQVYAGSDLLQLTEAARTLATEALPDLVGAENIDRQGRLQVVCDVGSLTPVNLTDDPTDPSGFVTLTVCAVVDDEIAYRHRTTGSRASVFVGAVVAGLGAAFAELDDPEAFFESIGIDGFDDVPNHISLGTTVQLLS